MSVGDGCARGVMEGMEGKGGMVCGVGDGMEGMRDTLWRAGGGRGHITH